MLVDNLAISEARNLTYEFAKIDEMRVWRRVARKAIDQSYPHEVIAAAWLSPLAPAGKLQSATASARHIRPISINAASLSESIEAARTNPIAHVLMFWEQGIRFNAAAVRTNEFDIDNIESMSTHAARLGGLAANALELSQDMPDRDAVLRFIADYPNP